MAEGACWKEQQRTNKAPKLTINLMMSIYLQAKRKQTPTMMDLTMMDLSMLNHA